jgi:hypothetical protein
MVVYDNTYHDKVIPRQATLEQELRSVFEEGEEHKLFKDPTEDIWFGRVLKNKHGKVLPHRQPSKQELNHAIIINSMLRSTPPKEKRRRNPSLICTWQRERSPGHPICSNHTKGPTATTATDTS